MHFIDQFAVRAKNYISTIASDPVYPTKEAVQDLEKFDTTLQQEPVDANEVLTLLDEIGSPATVKNTGGRYYGFVTGGSLAAAMSAKLLASVWDQNAAFTVMSPTAAKLETIAGKWMLEIFGLPSDCGFGFVTGDTMANFTALAAARHKLLKNTGWDAEAKGLFNAPEITIIVGEEVHVSVLKALSMLGLGRDRVIRIPADEQGRMIAEKIPVTGKPTIICTQAGNVNTGAFDPVEEICMKMKNENVWVHVDAAFGLWAAASDEKKYLVQGIEFADSWATDAHKWLNVPYDCGIVFVRDKEAHFTAMSSTAAYLPGGTMREALQYVPEMSRQARAVPVWAALKSLGTKGLAALIEKNCRQAVQFAGALTAAGFTVLNNVVLNQILVSFGDAAITLQVIKQVQEEGVCWCGGTEWQGKTAMRISVSAWNTTDDDVQQSLQSIIRQAKNVIANH
ncbi:MAG TPA: aminotransferase class V-fold PLP-dependent enzyme [Panacibacter sp.]|nr:aminotransferase class V-fold PLP-dependent enzyme [Panacibacter sp.]